MNKLRFCQIISWILLFISISLIIYYCLLSFQNIKINRNKILIIFNNSNISSTPSHLTTITTTKKVNTTQVRLAVVVSLSKQTSHIAEFHLLYESWRFIQNFSPLSEQVIVDLIVFCEQPSCSQLPSPCLSLSFNIKSELIYKCFYEELSIKIVEEWKDYLYMTSIAFMLTNQYRQMIYQYQWILRVDQDALLSPALLFALLNKHPIQLNQIQFGGVGHGDDFTHQRLKTIAKKLGYNHLGIHNLCSTWLVHPNDSIQIANLTTRIGRHFLTYEFGRNVSGIKDLPEIGKWPRWWRGVTSLYAGEIAINHLYSSILTHKHESSALDHPSYSSDSIWKAWHIHCLHNEDGFSKFKYRDQLNLFLKEQQNQRLIKMSNNSFTQNILKQIIDEFYFIQQNNGKITGKVTVKDYVTALAWQKTYAAIGAINLH